MVQRSFGQDRAFVQHGHPAIQAADEIHVVLHHHDRPGLGEVDEKGGGVFPLGRGHAGGRFVDKKKARLLRHEHCDFQPLLLAMAQFARFPRQMVAKSDLFGQHLHAFHVGAFRSPGQHAKRVAGRFQGQGQVVGDGLILEHGGALELAAHSLAGDSGLVQAKK